MGGLGLARLSGKTKNTIPPLPQNPDIQVFFNHTETNSYQDPYRHTQRQGDDLEKVLVEAVEQATLSIDIAIQELNLPNLTQALIAQARAGVVVRVILENQYSQPWSQNDLAWIQQQDRYSRGKYENLWAFGDINGNGYIAPEEAAQRDAVLMLHQAGIPIVDDTDDGTKGSGLMHHKFMVIDGQQVLTGTANFTLSGIHGDWLIPESRGNANTLLQIQSTELATAYAQEFNLMWGDGPDGKPDSVFGSPKPLRPSHTMAIRDSEVTVQFSPHRANTPWAQTTNGVIASALNNAKQVDLAMFVFTDQGIANTLQGIPQVRTLIDKSFIYRYHSEALDMLGLALPDGRCQYETANQPWINKISEVGYPALAEGDKLHHKFAVLDDHTVIVGSHNWSKAANHKNDENILIIKNETVAQHFKQEFERLYKHAKLGETDYLLQTMKKSQERCG